MTRTPSAIDGALDRIGALQDELDETRRALAMARLEPGAAGEARVRESLAAVKDELAVAEIAVETLRDELVQRTRERDAWMATSRENGAQRLRMEDSAADHLADRRQVQSERDEARAELEQVRAVLAPLWPVAGDGSAAAFAGLAAFAIVGYRIAEAERQAYATGLEPVAVWTDETLLEQRRPSRVFTFGQMLGIGIGALIVGAGVGAAAVGALVSGWPW